MFAIRKSRSTLFSLFNAKYAYMFRSIIDFPALRGAEVRMLFDLKTYPWAAINLKRQDTNTFPIQAIVRARLLEWHIAVSEEISNIIDGDEVANIKSQF